MLADWLGRHALQGHSAPGPRQRRRVADPQRDRVAVRLPTAIRQGLSLTTPRDPAPHERPSRGAHRGDGAYARHDRDSFMRYADRCSRMRDQSPRLQGNPGAGFPPEKVMPSTATCPNVGIGEGKDPPTGCTIGVTRLSWRVGETVRCPATLTRLAIWPARNEPGGPPAPAGCSMRRHLRGRRHAPPPLEPRGPLTRSSISGHGRRWLLAPAAFDRSVCGRVRPGDRSRRSAWGSRRS